MSEYQSMRVYPYLPDGYRLFFQYGYIVGLGGPTGYYQAYLEWRNGFDGWGLYVVQDTIDATTYNNAPLQTKCANQFYVVSKLPELVSNALGNLLIPPMELAPVYRVENVPQEDFKLIGQTLGSSYIYDDYFFIEPTKIEEYYNYERTEGGLLVPVGESYNKVFTGAISRRFTPVGSNWIGAAYLVVGAVLYYLTGREDNNSIPTLQIPIDSWDKIVKNQPAQDDWPEWDKLRPLPFVDIVTIEPDPEEEPPEVDHGIRLNAYIKIREVIASDSHDSLGDSDSFYLCDIFDMNGAYMGTVDWQAVGLKPPIAYSSATGKYHSYYPSPASLITASNFRAGNNLYVKVITLQDEFINNLLMWDNAPFLLMGQMREEASVLVELDQSEAKTVLLIEEGD